MDSVLIHVSYLRYVETYKHKHVNEMAAAVFGKRLQEHQDMSFVTKLNSWRRKHYKIRLDTFLY